MHLKEPKGEKLLKMVSRRKNQIISQKQKKIKPKPKMRQKSQKAKVISQKKMILLRRLQLPQ